LTPCPTAAPVSLLGGAYITCVSLSEKAMVATVEVASKAATI